MLQRLVTRFGVPASVGLLTLGAIGLCVLLVVTLAPVFHESVNWFSITYAIVVPLVLYPPLAFVALNYLNQSAAADKTLQLVANTDPLTTIFNRKHFLELGENVFALAKRHTEKFSIVFFDVDNFTDINVAHGRAAGDQVLRVLAELCRGHIRRSDVFARLENEEFVCLLPRTSNVGALNFAERLRQTVAATTVTLDKQSITFTISVGVKTLEYESKLGAVLNAAEQAMKQAKQQGRNRTVSA